GIEGLVHISEITYKKRILKPEEVVNTGETVSLLIKELDPHRRRISLSMRDVEGDPWLEVEGKYQAGQSITGTVDKKESFGYFITLEPGITGLLPASTIKRSANANRLEKLKAGDIVTVNIAQINSADRRISLTPGDEANEGDWKKFVSTSSNSLGSLGEKLQRAMQEKK
ncbi:MAG: S1 RNA-binding domain-containing protein, partial [Deltaproteobacteria bacterium]|nr:S1 RNA-binding domain-containing protein [Deltaproteobacteria bacterium]